MTLSTWRAGATSFEGADDYRSPDEAVNPTLPSSPRVSICHGEVDRGSTSWDWIQEQESLSQEAASISKSIVTSTNTFAISFATKQFRTVSTRELNSVKAPPWVKQVFIQIFKVATFDQTCEWKIRSITRCISL